MTVYVSRNDADSWVAMENIYAGASAYSSLAMLGEARVGLLFEKDDYKSIAFVSIDDPKGRE